MNLGRTVFTQVMAHLPVYEFQKCVDRYAGDYSLGGHLKTGHTWPLQNRPTKLSQNKSIYNPPMVVVANIFSQSNPKSLY